MVVAVRGNLNPLSRRRGGDHPEPGQEGTLTWADVLNVSQSVFEMGLVPQHTAASLHDRCRPPFASHSLITNGESA
jgi:hypothetical protein